MANESVELSVTPEVPKPCGVEIRRYSTGNASSVNSDEKVVPRYLRASIGSCHDFCKYGGKHAFDLKEKHSISNRTTRKQLQDSSEESISGITVSVARPRLSVDSKLLKVIPGESVDSKIWTSGISGTNTHELQTKSLDSRKHIGNEVTPNRKKTPLVKVKPSLLLKSRVPATRRQEISSSTAKEVQSPSKSASRKMETQSISTQSKLKTPSKSTTDKVETPSKSTPKKVKTLSKSTPDKVETLSKSTPKEVENPLKLASQVKTSLKSTTHQVETVSKPTPNKVGTLSRLTVKKVENPSVSTSKAKSSSKSTSKMMGTSSQLSSMNGKEKKLSEKHVTSLNSNRVIRKKASPMNSSEGSGDQRNSEITMEKKVASSKTASRKPMAPLKASSSSRISLKRVASINSRKQKNLKIGSHLRNQQTASKAEQEEHSSNEAEEKTLYVISMESENKTLQLDQNASFDDESYLPQLSSPMSSSSSVSQSLPQEDQEESEYTTSEYEQDSFLVDPEIECVENEGTLKVEKKTKLRKDEDKDSQLTKLKFRRGKVIENQIERNTPRRLKFRSAKISVEKANVKDDAQRKSFKRKDEAPDSDCATTGQEKVVLRHQDMQDKKDAQGLLNNVIEETASKLVEARKSKVKALVGAFETVISLQEKKPSANSVS